MVLHAISLRVQTCSLVSLLWLAFISCGYSPHPKLVDVPLLSCSGLPCLDVSFGRTPLRLLLDLANERSFLTTEGEVKAEADRSKGQLGRSRHFKLGGVELGNIFAINRSVQDGAPVSVKAPSVDGSLSYTAFEDRLLILDMPHHRIMLSLDRLKRPNCIQSCAQLEDTRATEMAGDITLSTDGFSIGNNHLQTQINTLYSGAVVVTNLLPSKLQSSVVRFSGQIVASEAQITRINVPAGPRYDSVVGLALLSKRAYAFDFRSMKMWLYDPNAK